MIVFHEGMWTSQRCGWSGSEHLSIDRFYVGHVWSVGKVGETVCADNAVDLSLSFFLNTRVDGHEINEAAGRRACLKRQFKINQSRGASELRLTVSDAAKRHQLAQMIKRLGIEMHPLPLYTV